MSSSLSGATGSNMRGLDPSMKHISGHHRFQQFTPQQMELFQQLFGQVGPESFLSQIAGGDQSAFEQMEQPALRQFSGLQGNLASRFSQGGGQGSLSARHSSGFQNQATSAASQFAKDLQAQRQGLQRQALGDLMGFSNALLGQQPYGLQEKQQKGPSGFGAAIGAGLGGLGGYALGGPWGGLYGAGIGSNALSGF